MHRLHKHHVIPGFISKESSLMFKKKCKFYTEEQRVEWKYADLKPPPVNVAWLAIQSKWILWCDVKTFAVDETGLPEGASPQIMHVSPCCRECTRHLQPDHSSSPHSLQLGLWVHPATLWPWKKQEPELHRVHPVSAGTHRDLTHNNLFRSGPRTDLTPILHVLF